MNSTEYSVMTSMVKESKKSGYMYCYFSVSKFCPTLCDPRDCSRSGFPVHHQLSELAQTHVHQGSDDI